MESMNLRRILEAQKLGENVKLAEKAVNEALSPVIKDSNLIDDVFAHFLRFCGCEGNALDVSKRRIFLFVAAYLFCPSSLIGKKMPSGLRQKLLDTMHIGAGSIISRYMSDLMFWYNHYKEFREDVNNAYSYVLSAMGMSEAR